MVLPNPIQAGPLLRAASRVTGSAQTKDPARPFLVEPDLVNITS
jgi:hypothetical protein